MIRADVLCLASGPMALLPLGLVALCLAACTDSRSAAGGLDAIRAALPHAVAGWTRVEPAELYDEESIYSYIDGHAEVYLAYGMRRCLAQRYETAPDAPGIVADVFELATPSDAYGVFTQDQEGEPVEVGNDALLRHGWLSFWKGPFFVSVYAEGEVEQARSAVLALGEAVAAAIPEAGQRPALVGELPAAGLEGRSVRYLHDRETLDRVLFLSEDNLLLLGADTEVVTARYRRDGEEATLLLADYPSPGRRARAQGQLERHLLGGRVGEPAQREDGSWCAVGGGGRRLVAALDAASGGLAGALLADSTKGEGR